MSMDKIFRHIYLSDYDRNLYDRNLYDRNVYADLHGVCLEYLSSRVTLLVVIFCHARVNRRTIVIVEK
jgi:hypothetical protein